MSSVPDTSATFLQERVQTGMEMLQHKLEDLESIGDEIGREMIDYNRDVFRWTALAADARQLAAIHERLASRVYARLFLRAREPGDRTRAATIEEAKMLAETSQEYVDAIELAGWSRASADRIAGVVSALRAKLELLREMSQNIRHQERGG